MKQKGTKPAFFKVLNGDFFQKLRIPPAFMKNLNGYSLDKCVLESQDGKKWNIEMEKGTNGLWFKDGWQEFAKGHSLEFGDFLVFKYHGNSKFSVKIFGKTCCEKADKKTNCQPTYEIVKCEHGNCEANSQKEAEYPGKDGHLRSAEKRTVIDVEQPRKRSKRSASSSKDASVIDVEQPMKRSKRSSSSSKDASEMKKRRHPTSHAKENQIQAMVRTEERVYGNCHCEKRRIGSSRRSANKPPMLSFKSKNPYFQTCMKDSNRIRLTIPRKLADQMNLKENQMVKFKVQNGKSWKVKVTITQHGRVDLIHGWTNFFNENNLEKYDILIFEYMQSGELQVHIFKQKGRRHYFKARVFNLSRAIKLEV